MLARALSQLTAPLGGTRNAPQNAHKGTQVFVPPLPRSFKTKNEELGAWSLIKLTRRALRLAEGWSRQQQGIIRYYCSLPRPANWTCRLPFLQLTTVSNGRRRRRSRLSGVGASLLDCQFKPENGEQTWDKR